MNFLKGVWALRETIDSLSSAVAALENELETKRVENHLLSEKIEELEEEKKLMLDKILSMAGAGPLRGADEPVHVRPGIESGGTARDYVAMANFLEAQAAIEERRRAAEAVAQEIKNG